MQTEDVGAARRLQILEVAVELLERDGAAALSTRSVAAAAGIRAASLYQLFGDKDGLLRAVAVLAFERYLASKRAAVPTGDPVEDIRGGWDAHVAFGLQHSALYLLMFGTHRPGTPPAAAEQAQRELLDYLDRVARAGRLRVAPAAAAELLQAGVTGVTLALIARPAEQRDLDVSTRLREAVIGELVTFGPPRRSLAGDHLATGALALDSLLAERDGDTLALRATETALLRDWLQRLAVGPPSRPDGTRATRRQAGRRRAR